MKRAYEQFKKLPNVTGTYFGFKQVGGRMTTEKCLVITVSKKVPPQTLTPAQMIPKEFDGTRTDVVEVGIVKVRELIDYAPPIRLGRSVGGENVTAGSVGAVVSFQGRPAIISNNHVLAASNLNPIGTTIYYPGLYDQKNSGNYKVGELAGFVPITFIGV